MQAMKTSIMLVLIIFLFSCYPECIEPPDPPEPFPINEEICNFIIGGDCGTFEQGLGGLESFNIPWLLFQADTISYEGLKCLKAEKTTLSANDTIVFNKDSIHVDSGQAYHLFAYINVEHVIEGDFPEIMMGYSPSLGDSIRGFTTWGGESGLHIWTRIILTFMPTKSKNIKVYIHEDNIVAPNGRLFIDKFKLIRGGSTDENKCCEFILPNVMQQL